jgi:hypothetical protein
MYHSYALSPLTIAMIEGSKGRKWKN